MKTNLKSQMVLPGRRAGNKVRLITGVIVASFGMVASDSLAQIDADAAGSTTPKASVVKATGEVEIVWPGGNGKIFPPGEEKLAFAEFAGFPATATQEERGEFRYIVLNPDLTPHRVIEAEVFRAKVYVSADGKPKAHLIGVVVSDTKACGGGGSSHDSGCDGGCSGGEDDGHDSGCSDAAPTPTGEVPDSGCSGSDGTTHEGGCSGSDGGTHDDGCGGGGSGGAGGETDRVSGRYSRVGQIVVIKMHDGGTPATEGDGINWKWFAPMMTEEDVTRWLSCPMGDGGGGPKLCKKTIIGGNLVVHLGPSGLESGGQ